MRFADVGTGYYAAAAALAIGALVAGPVVWSALDGEACPASSATELGGSFTLVSETGRRVTDRDVIAGPVLLYFGYTFCPDVCPIDAARNAEAVDALAAGGHHVTPVFISVDPARDTPGVLADYTDHLHPRMLGLSGTAQEVAAAADAYGVRYEAHDGDYYLVDHTTLSYLVTPAGVIDVLSPDLSAAAVADRIACHLSDH